MASAALAAGEPCGECPRPAKAGGQTAIRPPPIPAHASPFTFTPRLIPLFRPFQSRDLTKDARPVVVARLEGRRAVAAGPLGGVQRGVGSADEILGRLARLPLRDADRRAEA